MPEGPEVRRHADQVQQALYNQPLLAVMARTRQAKAWLLEQPDELIGQRVQRVYSRGKNLIIRWENNLFCYSHLMMWGRWQIVANDGELPYDRRERARFTTSHHHVILFSAPIFEIHRGDTGQIEALKQLGPESLPYPDEAPFDGAEFLRRLQLSQNLEREIGAILLDQSIVAGIGNYLRAEILFECRLDPFCRVANLHAHNLDDLCRVIPQIVRLAYENGGATVPDRQRQRMRADAHLVYAPGRDWGTRHWVFRRTNLPCLHCTNPIRQLRQTTRVFDDGEKSRIIYFCPQCQHTTVELKPARKTR